MTEPKQSKKISRRDAIKLLGAVTGATVLANLPSKWSTPEIASGVLPAHAQASLLYSLACDIDLPAGQGGALLNFGVSVSPAPPPSVTLHYVVTGNNGETINIPAGGAANVTLPGPGNSFLPFIDFSSGASGGSITVTWTFVNPAQAGSCSQTNAWFSN